MQDNNSYSVNPIFVFSAGIGFSLLLLLFLALCLWRNSKLEETPNVTMEEARESVQKPIQRANQKSQQFEVNYEYDAVAGDEIDMRMGNKVEIIERFDDGWARGFNVQSGKVGIFPLSCLDPPRKIKSSRQKRTSSLIISQY
jgi:Na+-transporting methylmalonyl-CoA/oxaloacetate decarboxylase gamma subunit